MHAIIVWGVLVSGAAIVVADESVTERVTDKSAVISKADNVNKVDSNIKGKIGIAKNTIDNNIDKATGISYRRWLQNAKLNENLLPNFGSFIVTRDEPLGIVGDIGEQWRQALLDTTDIREDLRAFVRAALVGQEYDLRASGESKLFYLSQRLPDIATDTLSAWGGRWAQSSSAIEHVNVEWRTDLGERPGHFALDVIGGLRETEKNVLAWQARGFVSTGGDDNRESGANIGLIWRQTALNDTALVGINGFLDFEQAYNINFWRWSLGVESHFGAFDFSANQYLPVTDGEEKGNYYIYSAKGRDVQAYVRLADFFQQQLFLDIAAGVTYYRWEGETLEGEEQSDGEDEGLRYGLRIGSYLNAPQALGQPLAMEFEVDEENDVRWRVSYLHYFGAPKTSFSAATGGGFLYKHTDPYNPRAQFYTQVRREYAQRIRRQILDGIRFELRSRGTDGLLQVGTEVNLYTGISVDLTVAVVTVLSDRGDVLTVSEITPEYKIKLSGSGVGASLLMNNLTLTDEGAILLTAGITEFGNTAVLVADITLAGLSPAGLPSEFTLQFILQDPPALVAPIIFPPGDCVIDSGDIDGDNNADGGGIGGNDCPEVGVDGNNYFARLPTPSDSVLLGGIGVDGSAPPYLITILNGHTSPRLLGISLTAASGRLFAYQPPHEIQIYGGHADVTWHHVDAQNTQNLLFTIAITAAGEQLERLVTIVPTPFEIGFSPERVTLQGLESGQSRTLSGISLTIAQYSGLPPYRYTVSGGESMISFYSLEKNAIGLVHHNPSSVLLSMFRLTVTVTDAGGREAAATLSVTINAELPTNDSDRNYYHYYLTTVTMVEAMGVYTLSLSGSSGYFAQSGALHDRLHFSTLSASDGIFALSLRAGPTLAFVTEATITYGDIFGTHGNITVSVLVALARFVAAEPEYVSQVVSRGVVANQTIAMLTTQFDDQGTGVERYEVLATDGSPLPASLNAQVVIVSNRLEWVSGGGNGALSITVAVRAINPEGRLSTVEVMFGVTDPPIPLALGTTEILISITSSARAVLTAEVRSETDDNGAHTITMLAEDGSDLPATIATLLSVNGTVLYVLGGTTGINATMQVVGLDADGRRSDGKAFTLRVFDSRIVGPSFVRLAGLVKKALVTLTLLGATPEGFDMFPEPTPGISLSLVSLSASEAVLTVISAYAADVTETIVLITLYGQTAEKGASRVPFTLSMRVTPFGLLMAGGEGVAGVQRHNEVWRFDTTDRYWERIGTLPSQLRNASPLFYNNTIFLLGGTKGGSIANVAVPATPRVAYSDDGGVTWRETRSVGQNFHLPSAVANAVPIIANGTLYMIGGRSNEGSADSPDTASALDTDFVKAFNLQTGAWSVVQNGIGPGGFPDTHPNYYLNAAYQNFAGYLDDIFFSFGGRPLRFGQEGFNGGQLVQFSYTGTPTAPSWLYGGMRINATGLGGFKTIGGQVAVFGGNGYAIGGESAQAVPKNLYLRINTSALSRTTQPASQPVLDVFTSANSVTGLPPANAIDTRYRDDGYRLFGLAKDHQPNLYIVGNIESGNVKVYVCPRRVAATCVNTSGNSGWTSIEIDTTISNAVPSARSNFMLIGVNNISWNEGN